MNQDDIDRMVRNAKLDRVITTMGEQACGCRVEIKGWEDAQRLRGKDTLIKITIWPCHADCVQFKKIHEIYNQNYPDKLEVK